MPHLNKLKALNPLIVMSDEDLQPSVLVAIGYARLLNEARILLRDRARSYDDVEDFERRCREQVGPIIETTKVTQR